MVLLWVAYAVLDVVGSAAPLGYSCGDGGISGYDWVFLGVTETDSGRMATLAKGVAVIHDAEV